MEYKDFSKNFIERTKDNLRIYSGKCEVTNLINCCLGLIIIPKEILVDKLSNDAVYEYDLSYCISKTKNCITDDYAPTGDNTFGLKNIVRHIRNGLSHGRIEQKTEGKEIVGLRIFDKHNSNENFSIEFKIEEFKTFALRVADGFLELEKQKAN